MMSGPRGCILHSPEDPCHCNPSPRVTLIALLGRVNPFCYSSLYRNQRRGCRAARDSHVLGKKARVTEEDTLLDSAYRRVGASFGLPAGAYQYRGSGSSVRGVRESVGPS